MEGPLPPREGSFSPEARYYIDRLQRKEHECNDLLAQFNKYKIKTKVRFDQLRHEINNTLRDGDEEVEEERREAALLLVNLADAQFRLEEAEKREEAMQREVERTQLLVNDQIILIKSLEEQLKGWKESEDSRERRLAEPVDMEKVQQQMMYKDERIVDLNNVILDKERQILDLQDACRSASEVATSKKEAMRIVQRKFDEIENRRTKEVATETDDLLGPLDSLPPRPSPSRRGTRTSSPGRAVHVSPKGGCSSPPPLDPADLLGFSPDTTDELPSTSKLAKTKVDGDSVRLKKEKQRKKVTFDLPMAASREDISRLAADADSEQITDAIVDLTEENERLRREVEEAKVALESSLPRVAQAEAKASEAEREARTASLKARAVAQARIRDLEDRMATLNGQFAETTERMATEAETLRSTRDWEVEQNAKMREQLASSREKLRQLKEELDASELANRTGERKVAEKEELMASLVGELEDAESLAVFLEEQKHAILDDVDQLRVAMEGLEEYIELLEADIVIYETRVGNLRDELGVSKINQRDHIKSKAFNTKLQMMNKEKEKVDRKVQDERLRTKALHTKVQLLEARNEELVAKICEMEMVYGENVELDSACKSVQQQMDQAETSMAQSRAELEGQLAEMRGQLQAANYARDSLVEECEQLRRGGGGQTTLHSPKAPSEAVRVAELVAAVAEEKKEREGVETERDSLAERVERMGGENFELTRRIELLEETIEESQSALVRINAEFSASHEEKEKLKRDAEEEVARSRERTEEMIGLRGRIAEREGQMERATEEIRRLREALDHAHLSMGETTAVKKELEQLKEILDHERVAGEEKWQQVAAQLRSFEELGTGGWSSRKTSMDESASPHALTLAEERARRAEEEREELRRTLEESERARASLLTELDERRFTREEERHLKREARDEEETEEMKKRIEELEEEATLSMELNVELGRAMEELRKKNENLEMERRLHEMMNAELTAELEEVKNTEEKPAPTAAPRPSSHSDSSSTSLSTQIDNSHAKEEQRMREEIERLQRAVHEERENRDRGAADKISRLEAALAEAETRKEEVERELARRKAETESLVRATSATFDAVSMMGREETPILVSALHSSPPPPAEEEEGVSTELLVEENVLLREAVYQNTRHQEAVTGDVARLLDLKDELEKAVGALRGEIWSLNGQLKASILDRENLQDRVVELDTKWSTERRRADILDSDLAEQVELTEKAQREAAEAENESNRRLAECDEMESRREELEKAYAVLAGYYSQLQEAYNVLYQRANVEKNEGGTQTEGGGEDEGTSTRASTENNRLVDIYASRLAQTRQQLASLRELSVNLTKSVLATELATLEEELENSIESIEGVATTPEEGVDRLLDEILALHGSDSSPDAKGKIAAVHAMLKAKIAEVERVHAALREQRSVCAALEERLSGLEDGGEGTRREGGEARELEERREECEALRRQVDDLHSIVNHYAAREEAARLATREADVDSLFRTNAELAHENVRLQNELDEARGEKGATAMDEEEMAMLREELAEEKRQRAERVEELQREKEELEMTIVDLSMQLKREMERETTVERVEEDSDLVDSLRSELAEETRRREAAEGKVHEMRQRKKQIHADAHQQKETLEAEINHLREAVDRLGRELEEKEEKEDEAMADAEKKTTEIKALTERIAALEGQQREQPQRENVVPLGAAEEEEEEGWGEEWGSAEEATPEKKALGHDDPEKEKMRTEVASLHAAIAALEERLAEEEVEREKAEEDKAAIQGTVDTLRGQVKDLHERLEESQRGQAEAEENREAMDKEMDNLRSTVAELEARPTEEKKVSKEEEEEGGWGEDWGEEEEGEEKKGEEDKTRGEDTSRLQEKIVDLEAKIEEIEEQAFLEKDELENEVTTLKKKARELEEILARLQREKEEKEEKEEEGGGEWGEEWGEDKDDEKKKLQEEVEALRSQLLGADQNRQQMETQLQFIPLPLNYAPPDFGEREGEEWGEVVPPRKEKEGEETMEGLLERVRELEDKLQETLDDAVNDKGVLEYQLKSAHDRLEELSAMITKAEEEGAMWKERAEEAATDFEALQQETEEAIHELKVSMVTEKEKFLDETAALANENTVLTRKVFEYEYMLEEGEYPAGYKGEKHNLDNARRLMVDKPQKKAPVEDAEKTRELEGMVKALQEALGKERALRCALEKEKEAGNEEGERGRVAEMMQMHQRDVLARQQRYQEVFQRAEELERDSLMKEDRIIELHRMMVVRDQRINDLDSMLREATDARGAMEKEEREGLLSKIREEEEKAERLRQQNTLLKDAEGRLTDALDKAMEAVEEREHRIRTLTESNETRTLKEKMEGMATDNEVMKREVERRRGEVAAMEGLLTAATAKTATLEKQLAETIGELKRVREAKGQRKMVRPPSAASSHSSATHEEPHPEVPTHHPVSISAFDYSNDQASSSSFSSTVADAPAFRRRGK